MNQATPTAPPSYRNSPDEKVEVGDMVHVQGWAAPGLDPIGQVERVRDGGAVVACFGPPENERSLSVPKRGVVIIPLTELDLFDKG